MPEPITSIQIRNERIKQLVAEEQVHGAGRNATEAAENLISEAVEARRVRRASAPDVPVEEKGSRSPTARRAKAGAA